MNKIGQVILVVCLVIGLYIIMLAVMPVVVDVTLTANTTITDSGVDIAAMPGSTDILILAPWFLWFAPAVIGMAVIVFILKQP